MTDIDWLRLVLIFILIVLLSVLIGYMVNALGPLATAGRSAAASLTDEDPMVPYAQGISPSAIVSSMVDLVWPGLFGIIKNLIIAVPVMLGAFLAFRLLRAAVA